MKKPLTNQTIWTTDFAEVDRKKALSRIKPYKRQKDVMLAPGITARNVIGQDVSILDRRSVKAQLAGRGDFRPLWWNVNCAVRQFLSKDGNLESVMCGFHRLHHALTSFSLKLNLEFVNLHDGMIEHGILRGIQRHYSN